MYWWGSLGHAGVRYWNAVPVYVVGVVVWMLFSALGEYERGGTTRLHLFSRCNTDVYNEASMPSVSESLSKFTRGTLPRLLVAIFVMSLLPIPKDYVLGNDGEVFFHATRTVCPADRDGPSCPQLGTARLHVAHP